eukprot:TRINITY_DN5683_c0_g1_i4.p1 TRINITY_DN5683_c0_g1~~TRINITY_DN5683_c0_g1_i4.p1  ORF type:complete len:325 (-),score=61.60 TRINITY_DN5683_c0_g1_i4:282-1256(-)
MACFAMIVKGLKYTWNIPIMCNIGNTFSHAFVPVGLLLVVVFFLLFGFAVVFQIKFAASQMVSFNSLGRSLFSVFRGLLGDMDTDGIFAAAPSFGPILFCLYVTVVLFVAFTILIALICESFAAVMDDEPQDGFIVNMVAWYRKRKGQGKYGVRWKDDSAVTQCALCVADFRTSNRRHHCRFCGDIFCGACSSREMHHPKTDRNERACDVCFNRNEGSPGSDGIGVGVKSAVANQEPNPIHEPPPAPVSNQAEFQERVMRELLEMRRERREEQWAVQAELKELVDGQRAVQGEMTQMKTKLERLEKAVLDTVDGDVYTTDSDSQ